MVLWNWKVTTAVRSDSEVSKQSFVSYRWFLATGMLDDKNIKWGAPFDSIPSRSNSEVAACKAKLDELSCVAKRAELVVQEMCGLDEAKFINIDMLVTHFCLQRIPESAEGNNHTSASLSRNAWKLNQVELFKKFGQMFGDRDTNPVQLPSKKELTKRAKVLLGSLLSTKPPSAGDEQRQSLPKNSYGFAVLDQGDSSNVLLAELLRGLLKAPAQSKEGKEIAKILCFVALKEARKRSSDVHLFGRFFDYTEKQLKQKCDNADMILKQLRLIEASLALSPRLYKNIVRVVLGESPIPGKTSDEPLFPDFKSLCSSDALDGSTLSQRSYGDRAIEQAIVRHMELRESLSSMSDSSLLLMTAVETVILSAACNHGLPVWNYDWSESFSLDNENAGLGMTWIAFGERLVQDVSKELSPERSKGSWETSCYEQILEYKAEPDTLAKKTILMLAKLLKKIRLSSPCFKSDHGLSGKVFHWFSEQVTCWSFALQLVDQGNEPLALTAVDFLDDVPSEERVEVRLVACFDEQGSQDVLGQAACVSKLRDFFQRNRGDSALSMIQQAMLKVDTNSGGWNRCLPTFWEDGPDDEILLKRLLCTGIRNLTVDEMMIAGAPLRRHKFTELVLNLRVNFLVSEFQDIELAGGGAIAVAGSFDTRNKDSHEIAQQDCHHGNSEKRKIEIVDVGESLIAMVADKKTRFV